MRKYALSIIAMILLVAGLDTVSPAEEALQSTMADLEKGWQNLDTASLEKTLKTLGEMAQKDPKDFRIPYCQAKARFALADCLDIKSDKEFDQTGEGDKHIDAALDLLKTSLNLKEDSVDTHILKFQILRRKMFHVSFPGLMMYLGPRREAVARAKELAPDNLSVQLMSAIEVEDSWPVPPPEQPVAEFEKLLKKDTNMAEAYYHIGSIWEKANKKAEAKQNYEKALALDPHHHWAQKKLKGLAAVAKAP